MKSVIYQAVCYSSTGCPYHPYLLQIVRAGWLHKNLIGVLVKIHGLAVVALVVTNYAHLLHTKPLGGFIAFFLGFSVQLA